MTLLPADTKRLQVRLNSHRLRALRLKLPAHDVRIEDLLAKSATDRDGNYLCCTCGCVLCFNPDAVRAGNKAHIGHIHHLSGKARPSALSKVSHPGHHLDNIEMQCLSCNEKDNHETVAPCNAKARKMEPVKGRPKSGKVRQRPVSPLSKDAPGYVKQRFGKRKVK